MSTVKFMDLEVGSKFKMNGIEYVKTPEERVSCCTCFNACVTANSDQKIQVLPLIQVEKIENA